MATQLCRTTLIFLIAMLCAMVEVMDAVFTVLLLVTFANLALAGFVLRQNLRGETNRVFSLTASSAALWTFTNALFLHTESIAVATASAQLSYLAAVILGASFLHFSWIFPLQRRFSATHKISLWLITLTIGFYAFIPGTVIRSVELSGNHSLETTNGIYVIAFFMLVTTLWAFGTFAWHHSSLHRVAREQSRWVLAGSALTAGIGLTCNLFLPLGGNYALVWLGPVSTLFFVGFSIYAIVAHHLFDIRLIIKGTLLYSLLVAAIGVGYSGIEHLLTEAIRHATANTDYAWIARIGGVVIVSVLAAPLRHWLEERLSRMLYRHRHKPNTRTGPATPQAGMEHASTPKL